MTEGPTDRATDPSAGAARDYRRLLVTGGAGFIGSCYVRDVLGRRDGTEITVLDKLTYAGNEANLAPVRADPEMAARLRFVVGDIADRDVVERPRARRRCGPQLRGGVARRPVHPGPRGVPRDRASSASTCCWRPAGPRRSGRAISRSRRTRSTAPWRRGTPARATCSRPRSPYAAAKASGELLVRSYVVTHGLDAVVTRGSNTYGPYHHPEKLIPLFVTNAIDDLPLPLYGDGLQRRDWLYVSDHAAGIDHVLRHGRTGETYNVAGGVEMTNRDTVGLLLEHLGKPWSLVRHVEDRPGHDRRYAMDGSKLVRARLARADHLRGRPGADDRLVRRQRAVVACRPNRGLGRLLRAPVRTAAADRDLMRVAVTGSTGRLGSALVSALGEAPFTGPRGPLAWTRAELDLDAPDGVAEALDRDKPEVVVHAAAWTDVDGCAREPDLAQRRNGDATGVLAAACAARGVELLIVSTNEVFAGDRDDRVGYAPTDPTAPPNAYGRSKLAGERAATEAFERAGRTGGLGIARTAWLFGPPGRDFPHKILDAAAKARAEGEPLRVVGDEWGTPTYAADVADAIVELLGARRARRGPPPRERRGRHASDVGGGRPGSARGGRGGGVGPGHHVGARVRATALGRAGRHAPSGRRAHAFVARGDGRLRARPHARAGARADGDDGRCPRRRGVDRPRPPRLDARRRPLRGDRPVRRPARLLPRDLARRHVRPDRPGRGRRAPRRRAALRPGQPLDLRSGRAARPAPPPAPARPLGRGLRPRIRRARRRAPDAPRRRRPARWSRRASSPPTNGSTSRSASPTGSSRSSRCSSSIS